MKAKAIVFREANKPALEELELPEMTPDEMLVKISFTGVSIGTEQSIFRGARTHNGTFPLVGGYMASGIVEQTGANVTEFTPGDRAAVSGARLDGEVTSVWGGHTSMQIINKDMAVKIPDETKMHEAAMFVMPGVGLNAIRMVEICEQDTVLISGQGLIGQFFGQWARARGAKIITLEPNEVRRNLSKKYVTQYALDPLNDNVEKIVEEITSGLYPTVVTEATANKKFVGEATKYLRDNAKMLFLSWYPDMIDIEFAHFHNYAIRAYFPTGAGDNETTRATLDCLGGGSITFGDNITDLLDYEKACEGYQRIIDGDKSIMGMVFDWSNA